MYLQLRFQGALVHESVMCSAVSHLLIEIPVLDKALHSSCILILVMRRLEKEDNEGEDHVYMMEAGSKTHQTPGAVEEAWMGKAKKLEIMGLNTPLSGQARGYRKYKVVNPVGEVVRVVDPAGFIVLQQEITELEFGFYYN